MGKEALWFLNRAEYARIWRRVTITAAPDPDPALGIPTLAHPCWLITSGPTTPNGYATAQRRPGESPRVVHRIMFEFHHRRPVADGMQLDHRCRRRNCCQPHHLEETTPSENTDRQDHANRGKDTCPKGHPYDAENTYRDPSGRRRCRRCATTRVPKPA